MSLRRYVSTAVETTLTTAVTAASTEMTATNPSGYPPEGPFGIRVDDEAVVVGTNTGGVFTDLERGFDGTSVVAHTTSVPVNHVAFGEDFRYRWLDKVVDRSWATYDDEFDTASLDPAWVEVTPTGTITWTQSNGVLSVTSENQAGNDVCVLVKPFGVLPSYTIETAVRVMANRANYTMIGLVLSDGTSQTSNAVACQLQVNATVGDTEVSQRSGTITNLASNVTTTNFVHTGPWLHMRLTWRNINSFGFEYSTDGVSWITFDNSTITTTFTPTYAGVLFSSWGDSTIDSKVGTYEFFRAYQ
jgi:hypothetical protein